MLACQSILLKIVNNFCVFITSQLIDFLAIKFEFSFIESVWLIWLVHLTLFCLHPAHTYFWLIRLLSIPIKVPN